MSNPNSQKTAVVNEVHKILGSSFDPSTPARDQLTAEQLKTLKSNIVAVIMSVTVDYTKDITD